MPEIQQLKQVPAAHLEGLKALADTCCRDVEYSVG